MNTRNEFLNFIFTTTESFDWFNFRLISRVFNDQKFLHKPQNQVIQGAHSNSDDQQQSFCDSQKVIYENYGHGD